MLIPLALSVSSLLTFGAGLLLALLDDVHMLQGTTVQLPQNFTQHLAVGLLICGALGLAASALVWAFRPKRLMRWPKCVMRNYYFRQPASAPRVSKCTRSEKGQPIDTTLSPDNTEVVMRSIRGIPYLIQAIQYSMETTYYKDMISQLGNGVVQTSVIHTAPGCTSMLDSDPDEEDERRAGGSRTPRLSGPDELWTPTSSTFWNNNQLRLSLNRASSTLDVFPYTEVSPHPDSFDRDSALELDDNSAGSAKSHEDIRATRTRSGDACTSVEIRCIGMSGTFLNKFNSSFRTQSVLKQ